MYEFPLIIAGLMLLWKGSDYAVEAARRVAEKLGVSELIIGLTITSIGTSLPEMLTNVMSALNTRAGMDASGIAVGNIIGSDLSQITLLLGIVGFIATLTIPKESLRRDGMMLIIATFLMMTVSIDGYVSQGEGVFLVLSYIGYLIYLFKQEHSQGKASRKKRDYNIGGDILKTFAGLIVVVIAADLVVSNGVALATENGIAVSIIGLLVGLGTSIPELTVSLKSISKKAGSLSLGNLIGSNITDPLLSFGLGASIAGVRVSDVVLQFDFPYWIASTSIALLLLYNHLNLNRKESSILVILYIQFMYIRLNFFSATGV